MASRPVVAAQVAVRAVLRVVVQVRVRVRVRVVVRVQERELLAAEAQLARSESAGVPGGR